MAIALGVSAKQAANSATSMTTPGVTSSASGSTFVITVCDPNQNITVSDSKSNSYTQIGTTLTVGSTKMSMWRCENGTGGASHTATVTWNSGSADGTITFAEITGAQTSSFDVTAQILDTASPYTVTSPTLSQADELAICFVGTDNAPISYGESTGFTIYQQETNSGLYWTSAALYKIVSSTAALTPSFSGIGSGFNVGVFIATFKEDSGAPDTTAPTLTGPTGTSTGTTTAQGQVTTDEANGTMYAVVSTSATPPSVAQIQAGNDSTGSAAAWSGNQAITTTGAKTFNATGLTASTSYYFYFQHRDAATNDSTVSSSAQLTTDAPAAGYVSAWLRA